MGWGGFYGQNYYDSVSISSFPFQLFMNEWGHVSRYGQRAVSMAAYLFKRRLLLKIWHSYSSIRRLGLAFLPLNNTDGLCRRVWLQMLAFAWPPQLICFYLSSCTFMSLIPTYILPWWFTGKKIHLQMQKMKIQSLGQEDPLEKEITTHSSILAWEIPWTEEPGGL